MHVVPGKIEGPSSASTSWNIGRLLSRRWRQIKKQALIVN